MMHIILTFLSLGMTLVVLTGAAVSCYARTNQDTAAAHAPATRRMTPS
ncbi:hypothetical protein [Acidomonas methanolica]|nr:hypothetical protein [Acidomonas methanolica]MBU2652808.1 hypothetical protein [Acidomonas methanolica]TCS31212.1 hypothetical protein EDC31_10353 [Acidomonas methanolica]